MFAIVNPPAWATFSSRTGQLTGMPSAANVGTYANIVIAVSDGRRTATLAPFTVQVVAAATCRPHRRRPHRRRPHRRRPHRRRPHRRRPHRRRPHRRRHHRRRHHRRQDLRYPATSVVAGSRYMFQPTASDPAARPSRSPCRTCPLGRLQHCKRADLGHPEHRANRDTRQYRHQRQRRTASSALPAFSITVTTRPLQRPAALLTHAADTEHRWQCR